MWISQEKVAEAKEMDALTWLKFHEPWNLVHIKGCYYRTKEHDSLKLDRGKWCWWSRGIGGRSALDYLIKVKGFAFQEAVYAVLDMQPGDSEEWRIYFDRLEKDAPEEQNQEFVLPEPDKNNDILVRYLTSRGIDGDIISYFINKGELYQEKEHKNVVFIGRDYEENIRFAAMRGTRGRFHFTVKNSDRTFPFRSICYSKVLHLFEAPIDMLSWATLLKLSGLDFRYTNMMSLCGLWQPKKDGTIAVPGALTRFLEKYPDVEEIVTHFDNDKTGRTAAEALQTEIDNVKVKNEKVPDGKKDVNEYLLSCMKGGKRSEQDKTDSKAV